MIDFPILSILTLLPLVGVLFLLFVKGDDERVGRNAKFTALYTSVFTFIVSLYMFSFYDTSLGGLQLVETHEWFEPLGIQYQMGVDGLSIFFILLATLLTPICILCSWESVKKRVREYMIAFLILETFMIGMFAAQDALLFYIFFEAVLIPMYIIIGVWGGPRRVYAAFKFFLYTLLGSVLMLIALLYLYYQAGTTEIVSLYGLNLPKGTQIWIFLAFFASFAVKVPMWPVHTWLPDAHVEAPTAGSVILAGVLLKMGGYGFLRFAVPIVPVGTEFFVPFIMTLSVIAIIYTSLVALVQKDMKKLIAYSSVAHMGYVTLGTFALNMQGLQGAVFQMLSHGVVSAALFLCVGVVYDRLHTRDMERYGGLVNIMPNYALVFMIFVLASVGLPGTSGFVGEFLSLAGGYQSSSLFGLLAGTGLVLGAAYMLWLYRKVIFGELINKDAAGMVDLSKREIAIFAPLIALVFFMGIYPSYFLDPMAPTMEIILNAYYDGIEQMAQAPDISTLPQIVFP